MRNLLFFKMVIELLLTFRRWQLDDRYLVFFLSNIDLVRDRRSWLPKMYLLLVPLFEGLELLQLMLYRLLHLHL